MKKICLLISLVLISLLVVSCTANEIAIAEDIVKAIEIAEPIVAASLSSTAASNLNWLNTAATIADDLLMNGTTATGVSKAAKDFVALGIPQIDKSDPKLTGAMNAVTAVVNNFTSNVNTATTRLNLNLASAFTEPSKADKKFTTFNAKQKNKLQELHNRLKQVLAKIDRDKKAKTASKP